VRDELARRVEALVAAGVDEDRLVLDPGFGFAKRAEHGWALLAHLDALAALGRPLLVGTSRKRFLAQAVAAPSDQDGQGAGPQDRDAATAATSALAAAAGAWAVRVHEARGSADAVRVAAAVAAARAADSPASREPV
jgi:dihydropteroate synthase